jgi:hypothetical protein
MANHEQDGIGDEDELFSEMLSGDAPKFDAEPDDKGTDEPAALEPEKATRERDEFGRFKARSQDTQEQPAEAEPQTQVEAPVEAAAQDEPEPEQPPSKDDDAKGMVPSWRAREYREERDAERNARLQAEQKATALEQQAQQAFAAIQQLQHQIHQLQNPPKPQEQTPVPNLFEDPDAFVGTVEQKLAALEQNFQRQRRQDRLEMNLALTNRLHPEEFPVALEEFYREADRNPALKHRVFSVTDHGAEILAWHREQKTLKEIGNDPQSYVQRKLDEALKDPAFLAKALEAARAQAGGQPVVSPTPAQPAARPNTVTQLPPSLRSVPGAAASSQSTGVETLNDAELFDSIVRR